MSFDWRHWSCSSFTKFASRRRHPTGHRVETGARPDPAPLISPATCGLLVALFFASYYALTSDFWTAALLAASMAAGMAVLALLKAHRATIGQLETCRSVHKLVAENTADLITRHDPCGGITYASPAARTLLGVSPSRLMRHGLTAAMSASNAARCHDALTQCFELGTPATVEIEIIVDGAPRWVEFRCRPLEVGDTAVAVMRDITQRRWHAMAMRQACEEAESASRAKSAFIATISHELRTPLNAIIGFSEMLQRELHADAGASRHAEYSRIIRESGEHLMSLVKDLLDISKIEAGRFTIFSEPFRTPDMIASSVDALRPAIAAKSLALEISLADDLGEMVADQRACKQMLMNLLSNACKFTPEGGRIGVAAELDGGNVIISVRDNGIGIAPDCLARLGEPFYQVDSSHARQLDGAGLGLAIVRGLADLHGGRLEIESTQGEGSCFRLVLPLGDEARRADPMPEVDERQRRPEPAAEVSSAPPIALVA